MRAKIVAKWCRFGGNVNSEIRIAGCSYLRAVRTSSLYYGTVSFRYGLKRVLLYRGITELRAVTAYKVEVKVVLVITWS